MNKYLKVSSLYPLLPVLVAISPVLALYAENYQELQTKAVTRAFIAVIVFAVILVFLSRIFTRNWFQSYVLTVLLLILFFSYGHVHGLVSDLDILGFSIGRHRYLLALWLVLLCAGYVWIVFKIKGEILIGQFILFATLGFIFVSVVRLLPKSIEPFENFRDPVPLRLDEELEVQAVNLNQAPDVYYIVVDSYGRDDILRDWFDYNNSSFTQSLEELGFYVASDSNANYVGTTVSLGASLNLDYVQELEIDLDAGVYPKNMEDTIKHSIVRERFENLGYATVAFPTDYYPTELEDADYYFTPGVLDLDLYEITRPLNQFESLLVRSSLLRAISDIDVFRLSPRFKFVSDLIEDPNLQRRELVLFVLESLKQVSELESPKFVFVHIQSPHEPYVFNKVGEIVPEEKLRNREGNVLLDLNQFYIDQLHYLNSRLLETIENIIEKSEKPPIIILQSDHGPEFIENWDEPDSDELEARLAILNAYYLPEDCNEDLYPTISPVNSFRIVFNCLGLDMEGLLPDKSYYSNLRGVPEDRLIFTPVDSILK